MNRNITIVLVAIFVLSMAIYFIAGRRSGETDPLIGKHVLPELKENLANVVTAEVKSGSADVRMERREGSWIVANRDGYPVDFARLSGLLDGIADAKLIERKTAKPENFGELGLRAITEEGSKAVLVTIGLAGGDEFKLLVGNSAGSARKGTYVRLPDQDQAWLTASDIKPASDVAGWLSPTIVDIDSARIDRVTMKSASGEAIRVEREEDPKGDFKLLDIPAGKKLRYDTIANTLARALSNVRLKDVAPALDFDWSKSGTAEFHCTDGLLVRVKSKSQGERYYLAFTAAAEKPAVKKETAGKEDEPAASQLPLAQEQKAGTVAESASAGEERTTTGTPPAGTPAAGTPAAGTPAAGTPAAGQEESKQATEKKKTAAEEASDLTAKLDPWVFEVTQYTYGLFTKTMSDLTEEEEKPEKPADKAARAAES